VRALPWLDCQIEVAMKTIWRTFGNLGSQYWAHF